MAPTDSLNLHVGVVHVQQLAQFIFRDVTCSNPLSTLHIPLLFVVMLAHDILRVILAIATICNCRANPFSRARSCVSISQVFC
jgi:hypothetical protein